MLGLLGGGARSNLQGGAAKTCCLWVLWVLTGAATGEDPKCLQRPVHARRANSILIPHLGSCRGLCHCVQALIDVLICLSYRPSCPWWRSASAWAVLSALAPTMAACQHASSATMATPPGMHQLVCCPFLELLAGKKQLLTWGVLHLQGPEA